MKRVSTGEAMIRYYLFIGYQKMISTQESLITNILKLKRKMMFENMNMDLLI